MTENAADPKPASQPEEAETLEPTRSQLLLEGLQTELAAWSLSELKQLRDDLGDLIVARQAEPVDEFELTPGLWFWLRQVAQQEQAYQLGQQSAAASYYWQLQQLGYVEARGDDSPASITYFRLSDRGRALLSQVPH